MIIKWIPPLLTLDDDDTKKAATFQSYLMMDECGMSVSDASFLPYCIHHSMVKQQSSNSIIVDCLSYHAVYVPTITGSDMLLHCVFVRDQTSAYRHYDDDHYYVALVRFFSISESNQCIGSHLSSTSDVGSIGKSIWSESYTVIS